MSRSWHDIRLLLGMELPLCVYMITSYLKTPDYNLCTNVTAYYQDHHIQADANHFYSISSYCLILPSLFTTLLLGVASDCWTVKVPLLIPFTGLILGTTNYIIQTHYMSSNVYLLLISDVIFGICGGYISIISTTMSYGVKVTKTTKRSYRIAVMEGAIGLGGTLGYALSGTLRQALGYTYVFVLILVLQTLCFMYIVIVAEEAVFEEDGENFIAKVKIAVGELWDLLTSRRAARLFILLNLVALGLELFIFSGLSDIQYSFLLYKLQWHDQQYGWYSGLQFGLSTVAVLFLYPVLRARWASDGQLGCLGMLAKMASLILMAFVVNPAMAYSAAILTMFNRFVSSGFRAFLSGLIATNEQGKMFSLVALLEGATSLIATAVYNNVYPLTLAFFPGFLYIMSAILLLPAMSILGWSDWRWRSFALLSEQPTSDTEYQE